MSLLSCNLGSNTSLIWPFSRSGSAYITRTTTAYLSLFCNRTDSTMFKICFKVIQSKNETNYSENIHKSTSVLTSDSSHTVGYGTGIGFTHPITKISYLGGWTCGVHLCSTSLGQLFLETIPHSEIYQLTHWIKLCPPFQFWCERAAFPLMSSIKNIP